MLDHTQTSPADHVAASAAAPLRSSRRGRGSAPRERSESPLVSSATMTPMIDVVFLLIVFFMLVAQFTRQQTVEMLLTVLDPTAAIPALEENRLLLNIVPAEQREALGATYIAGGLAFAGTEADAIRLIEVMRSTARRQAEAGGPPLEVMLRAQRSEPYAAVHEAMELVRQAGVGTVHLMSIDGATAARLERMNGPASREGPAGGPAR